MANAIQAALIGLGVVNAVAAVADPPHDIIQKVRCVERDYERRSKPEPRLAKWVRIYALDWTTAPAVLRGVLVQPGASINVGGRFQYISSDAKKPGAYVFSMEKLPQPVHSVVPTGFGVVTVEYNPATCRPLVDLERIAKRQPQG